MGLRLEQYGERWKIIYSVDAAGNKILWDVTGDGDVFVVPAGVKEIRKRAISVSNCPFLKRVMIPSSVRTIQRGAFDGFNSDLVVFCASPEKPAGFFEGEYEEVFEEDGAPYYVTHYGSWLCRSAVLRSRDEEGRLTWASFSESELSNRPRVRWGCTELA